MTTVLPTSSVLPNTPLVLTTPPQNIINQRVEENNITSLTEPKPDMAPYTHIPEGSNPDSLSTLVSTNISTLDSHLPTNEITTTSTENTHLNASTQPSLEDTFPPLPPNVADLPIVTDANEVSILSDNTHVSVLNTNDLSAVPSITNTTVESNIFEGLPAVASGADAIAISNAAGKTQKL